jgi:molybdopterin/thiamine biosynthesis adenylyltransferase
MSTWALVLGAATAEFTEALQRHGFARRGDIHHGTVDVDGDQVEVQVRLPPTFPFAPPRVYRATGVPPSWHSERDGALCLYRDDEKADLPWLDVEAFLGHVAAWLRDDAAGWPDDEPDLDLERYFPRAPGLLVYTSLEGVLGGPVRYRQRPHGVIELAGRGVPPPGKRRHRHRGLFGWAADLGELAWPPRTWEDLTPLLGTDAAKIEQLLRGERVGLLALRYRRGGHVGVLALRATRQANSDVLLEALTPAPDTPDVRALRAGPHYAELARCRVLLVGVGAVGSFLADLLVRVGVRELTLRDGDVLRPGNCVRHLAGREHVGKFKVAAVRDMLTARYGATAERVVTDPTALTDPEGLRELLGRFDLVIDATADSIASALLATVAVHVEVPIVSVCLQREGAVIRVDHFPQPASPADVVPAVAALSYAPDAAREAGCGEPVSRTPPSAVVEAAAVACRHAVAVLLSASSLLPTELRLTAPQADVHEVGVQ